MRSLVSFTTARSWARQARTQVAAVEASTGATSPGRLSQVVVAQAGNERAEFLGDVAVPAFQQRRQ